MDNAEKEKKDFSYKTATKKELKERYAWFLSIIPERFDMLINIVKNTAGYEQWEPDCTPESLLMLGDWFAHQVKTRKRTSDEMRAIQESLKFPIEISDNVLTDLSISMAIDVGIYLSQVFLKNHPSLKWELQLGGKRYIDYGRAVIVKFEVSPFNPVRMVKTFAYGILSKHRTGSGLYEIYEIWSKKVI